MPQVRPLSGLVFFCLMLLLASPRSNAWPQTRPSDPLSIDEVVKLSKAGFSEEVIITKIKKNGKAFDLSTDELLDLKKAGLKDTIINYLLDPSLPYSPPPPPAPPPPPPVEKAPGETVCAAPAGSPGQKISAGSVRLEDAAGSGSISVSG